MYCTHVQSSVTKYTHHYLSQYSCCKPSKTSRLFDENQGFTAVKDSDFTVLSSDNLNPFIFCTLFAGKRCHCTALYCDIIEDVEVRAALLDSTKEVCRSPLFEGPSWQSGVENSSGVECGHSAGGGDCGVGTVQHCCTLKLLCRHSAPAGRSLV